MRYLLILSLMAGISLFGMDPKKEVPLTNSRVRYCAYLIKSAVLSIKEKKTELLSENENLLRLALEEAGLDSFDMTYLTEGQRPNCYFDFSDAPPFLASLSDSLKGQLFTNGRFPLSPSQLERRLDRLGFSCENNYLARQVKDLYSKTFSEYVIPSPRFYQNFLARIKSDQENASFELRQMKEKFGRYRQVNRLQNYRNPTFRIVREKDFIRLPTGRKLKLLEARPDGTLVVKALATEALAELNETSSIGYSQGMERMPKMKKGFKGVLYASGHVAPEDPVALFAYLSRSNETSFPLEIRPSTDGEYYAHTLIELVNIFYPKVSASLLSGMSSVEQEASLLRDIIARSEFPIVDAGKDYVPKVDLLEELERGNGLPFDSVDFIANFNRMTIEKRITSMKIEYSPPYIPTFFVVPPRF